MFRLLAYIASLFCLFFLSQEAFGAEDFVGNRIGITGTSSDVVIDARAIIDAGATVGPAIFDAQTNTLSGGMYIKGIGWAAFATGSYQVTMSDCPPSKHSCALNGTGWSDQIGEINFSGVSYSRIAQKLQGSVRTHAGDFSLAGIDIAYGPASISGGNTLKAHHHTSVQLTNPSRYTGKILTLDLKHIDTHQSKRYTATGGVFRGVDLSIAGTYQASIEVRNPLLGMHPDDQLESRTTLSIQVIPNTPTSVRQSGSYYALQTYCTTVPNPPSSICPDGTTLQSTTLSTENASAPADGESTITYTLKLRDQYGNRAQSGSVKIVYNSTLDRIQIGDWDNMHFFLEKGPALISPHIQNAIDTAWWTFDYNGITDITYSLASYAPTSATSALTLKRITYNGTSIALPSVASPTFTAPWEATVGSGGTIYTITAHNFPLTLTQKTEAAVGENTSVITRFTIENADSNTYMAITDPSARCKKHGAQIANDKLCDWILDGSFVAFDASPLLENAPYAIRTFYQTLFPKQKKSVTAQTYIYSTIGEHDVLYPSWSPSTFRDIEVGNIPPVRLLGQSGELLANHPSARGEFFNAIRKMVSLLRRNITDTSSLLPYSVETKNTLHITGTGSFSDKRSLISVGQDILITENIIPSEDTAPLAIISLAENGQGGNIVISGAVTDIHASLIAERGIIGTGATDRQLYIFGSLLTTNVFAEGQCPFFTTSGSTECKKYDVSKLRPDFDNSQPNTQSQHPTAQAAQYTPVVIEQDGRLSSDPPPGLIEIK